LIPHSETADEVLFIFESLLWGILYCGECGLPMVPMYGKKNGRKHFYYVCQKCQKEGYKSCPTKTVRQKEFNDAVLEQLFARGLIEPVSFKRMDVDTQNLTLSDLIPRITYEYKEENIRVLLNDGEGFTFHAKVKPQIGRQKVRKSEVKQVLKLDRETYYKTLALQIREYMKANHLNQKECAEALGLSQARVCQLMKY